MDVVGTLIDYKESEAFEKSQLVFISQNRTDDYQEDPFSMAGTRRN